MNNPTFNEVQLEAMMYYVLQLQRIKQDEAKDGELMKTLLALLPDAEEGKIKERLESRLNMAEEIVNNLTEIVAREQVKAID